MRVLILSVTAGYGHHSTAQAIADELTSRGVNVVIEDLYQQVSKTLYEVIDNGYLFSVQHMKRQFKNAYESLERNERMRRVVSILTANRMIARRFATYLEEYKPDVIVATHVFAAQVLNILKNHGYINVPVIGIVTDYCIQPFWEELHSVDYIVTGSELLNYIAVKKGLAPEKLLPVGLPIKPSFRNTVEKTEARSLLGLQEDKQTVLVMGGSMGYGNMMAVISEIDAMDMGLQIVCICGNNEKLRNRLNYLKTKSKLIIKGFIRNVELYMDAADCIVTKPGGLTVTEVLSKKLPMILIDPIPGHEVRNAEFLTNNGAAIRVTESFSISEAVYFLFSNQQRLELMRKNIELIAHPGATEKICDHILSLGE